MKKILAISLLASALVLTASANAGNDRVGTRLQPLTSSASNYYVIRYSFPGLFSAAQFDSQFEFISSTYFFERDIEPNNFEKFMGGYHAQLAHDLGVRSNNVPLYYEWTSKNSVIIDGVDGQGYAVRYTYIFDKDTVEVTSTKLKGKPAKTMLKRYRKLSDQNQVQATAMFYGPFDTWLQSMDIDFKLDIATRGKADANEWWGIYSTLIGSVAAQVGVSVEKLPIIADKTVDGMLIYSSNGHSEPYVTRYGFTGRTIEVETRVVAESDEMYGMLTNRFEALDSKDQEAFQQVQYTW